MPKVQKWVLQLFKTGFSVSQSCFIHTEGDFANRRSLNRDLRRVSIMLLLLEGGGWRVPHSVMNYAWAEETSGVIWAAIFFIISSLTCSSFWRRRVAAIVKSHTRWWIHQIEWVAWRLKDKEINWIIFRFWFSLSFSLRFVLFSEFFLSRLCEIELTRY